MAGQGYTPSIGSGSTVLPSQTDYAAYFIATGDTVQLQWPVDNFPANSNVVASVINATPLGNGCALQMPNAQFTSLGEKSLIFNAGSVVFNVLDSVGNTITAVGPGIAIYLALTNNLTVNGNWISFTFGAGTSEANSAALAGAGLAPDGVFLDQVISVSTIAVNYTVGLPDRANAFNWTGGVGTISLPAASSVKNNFYIQVRNSGTGSLTIAPNGTDLINGAATLVLNVSDSCFIVTDGTQWITLGLGQINTNSFNFQTVNLGSQSGTYVLPSNQQNKVAYRFTGALAGNTKIQVPATIQQYWVDNETTGGTLTIATATQVTPVALTAGARYILYCDSNNVLNADTGGIATPVQISAGGTGATTANGALTNLGGTSIGVGVFTAADAATAQGDLQVPSTSDAEAWALIF